MFYGKKAYNLIVNGVSPDYDWTMTVMDSLRLRGEEAEWQDNLKRARDDHKKAYTPAEKSDITRNRIRPAEKRLDEIFQQLESARPAPEPVKPGKAIEVVYQSLSFIRDEFEKDKEELMVQLQETEYPADLLTGNKAQQVILAQYKYTEVKQILEFIEGLCDEDSRYEALHRLTLFITAAAFYLMKEVSRFGGSTWIGIGGLWSKLEAHSRQEAKQSVLDKYVQILTDLEYVLLPRVEADRRLSAELEAERVEHERELNRQMREAPSA